MNQSTQRVCFGDEDQTEQLGVIVYQPPRNSTCPDCGVTEGELHAAGCDREQCPICGYQLIGCEHANEIL